MRTLDRVSPLPTPGKPSTTCLDVPRVVVTSANTARTSTSTTIGADGRSSDLTHSARSSVSVPGDTADNSLTDAPSLATKPILPSSTFFVAPKFVKQISCSSVDITTVSSVKISALAEQRPSPLAGPSCANWVGVVLRAVRRRQRHSAVFAAAPRPVAKALASEETCSVQSGPSSLDTLASEAEATLRGYPVEDQEGAERVEDVMTNSALCGTMKPEHVAACRELAFGKALKALHQDAMALVDDLDDAPASAAKLTLIRTRARATIQGVLLVLEEHMARIGWAVTQQTPLPGGLLPDIGPPYATGEPPLRFARRIATLVNFTIAAIGGVCVRYSVLAMSVAEAPEASTDLKAHARTVKRELCLLRGTATHQSLRPLRQVAAILKVRFLQGAMPPPDIPNTSVSAI